MSNLLLAIFLFTINSETNIQWYSMNVTGVINSQDNYHSLSGCLSISNVGLIRLTNSASDKMPSGIVGGFWSSECDINLKDNQTDEDFFPIADSILKFRLYANKPNPFTKSTTIRYEIPIAGKVELVIFDISGRRVRQLINENQSAGRYNIAWDGLDLNNKECSAGIYFVSMKTSNYKKIRKILRTK